MSGYDWVELPDRDAAGLEGIDTPMANWWQLRRQGVTGPGFIREFITLRNYLDFFPKGVVERLEASGRGDQPLRELAKPRFPGALGKDLEDEDGDLKIPALPTDAICTDARVTPRTKDMVTHDIRPDTVLLGVIDDALPCFHPDLRHDGKTRFVSLWQQDARCQAGDGPSPVPFGHMVDGEEIDGLIQAGRGEDLRAYEDLGLVRKPPGTPNLYRFRASHGSAVTGLMAGAGRDAPDDAITRDPGRFPLIGVNLGLGMVEDTAGSFLPLAVLYAIQHIVNEAEALMDKAGIKVPLVINLSFGLAGGGRDGSDHVAQFLDVYKHYWEEAHGTPFRAVLPAGNGFQDRGVIATDLQPGGPARDVTLRAGPGSRASTVVEIERLTNSAEGSPFALQVAITPPGQITFATPRGTPGQPKEKHKHGDAWVLQSVDNRRNGKPSFQQQAPKFAAVFYTHRPAGQPADLPVAQMREVVTLAIQPDQTVNGDEPSLPPGDWTLSVSLNGAPDDPPETVELRILRNDIPSPVLPRGQTARFVDPMIRRFDAAGFPTGALCDPGARVRRDRTISAMATGRTSVVVGAVQDGSGPVMAPYSAAGPIEGTKAGQHWGVTLCAPGDDSLLRPGRRSLGLRAGATTRVSGSSIAAPQVARWIADAMARAMDRGENPGTAADTDAFTKAADKLPCVPDIRQGYGRLL